MCYGPICEFMQNPPHSNLPSERSRWHTEILRACECSHIISHEAKVYCIHYVCFLFVCLFVFCLCVCPPTNSATDKDRKTKKQNKLLFRPRGRDRLIDLDLENTRSRSNSNFLEPHRKKKVLCRSFCALASKS